MQVRNMCFCLRVLFICELARGSGSGSASGKRARDGSDDGTFVFVRFLKHLLHVQSPLLNEPGLRMANPSKLRFSFVYVSDG